MFNQAADSRRTQRNPRLDFERERLMADGDLRRRRISQRLIKLKEARSESEASRMIKLKKEWRALLDPRF